MSRDLVSQVFVAAELGDNALKALLQNGADVNAVNKYKRTPIYRAVGYGHIHCFNYCALVLRLTKTLSKTTRLSYFV